MGGRGASFGHSIDKNGNPKNKYGTQYHTVLEVDNIKFVQKNTRQSEALMETMSNNREYVEVGGNNLLRIVTFGADNKRNVVLERDKRTDEWHKHMGYLHGESGKERHLPLTDEDKKHIEKIKRLWYNRRSEV